jgi:hypothetical protein
MKFARYLACVAVLLSIAIVVANTSPPPTAFADTTKTHQGEALSWVPGNGVSTITDGTASGGQAKQLTQNSSATIINPTDGAISNINVRARGVQAGDWPVMRITLNGAVIANQSVNSTAWTNYQFPVTVPAPTGGGNNTLAIAFTNQQCGWWFWTYNCSRVLLIDNVIVTEPTPVTTTPSTTTTTTPPPPTGAIPAGSKYVALGDSYGSGYGADRNPGVPINNTFYDDGSPCGRSNKSAQRLLATQWDLELINAACGGASTNHILVVDQIGEGTQISKVAADTDFVSIIIGGNDSALMYMLIVCVNWGNCVPQDWFGSSFIGQMNAKINALQPQIENVLKAVATKAPQARIRIMGYPNIIAPPGQPRGSCAAWLTAAEQGMFADATKRTNDAIKKATEVVAAQRGTDEIKYVDPLAVGSPFDPAMTGCSTSNSRYMNGPLDGGDTGQWHPNMIGAEHYKTLLAGSVT